MNRRAFLGRLLGVAIAPLAVVKAVSSETVRGGWVRGGTGVRDDVPMLLGNQGYLISRAAWDRIKVKTIEVINEQTRYGGVLRR